VLIENGDLDGEVPQESIDEWKKEMDEHNIDWRFNVSTLTCTAERKRCLSPSVLSVQLS
jgi:hypothetical protein